MTGVWGTPFRSKWQYWVTIPPVISTKRHSRAWRNLSKIYDYIVLYLSIYIKLKIKEISRLRSLRSLRSKWQYCGRDFSFFVYLVINKVLFTFVKSKSLRGPGHSRKCPDALLVLLARRQKNLSFRPKRTERKRGERSGEISWIYIFIK